METYKTMVAVLFGIVLGTLVLFVIGKVFEEPRLPTDSKTITVGADVWTAPLEPLAPTDIFNRGY